MNYSINIFCMDYSLLEIPYLLCNFEFEGNIE